MNGLLLIDKPRGMTSHDVVARVRRTIAMRAIGHAGTLDPFATGLLILCIGQATRLSEYLIGETKAYAGTMKLGERTNTDDVEGEVVERRPVSVTSADLERVCADFTGDLMQVPPLFSAIQVGGRRAYKMARSGETVELVSRPVRIVTLELAWASDAGPEFPNSLVDLRVTCSAGTYIRALARDMGEVLGCGAHLIALRRTHSGSFNLQDAVTLDALQQAAAAGDWQRLLLPMDRAVQHLPPVRLDAAAAQRFVMGQAVAAAEGAPGAPCACRVYDADGQFIAIGTIAAGGGGGAAPGAVVKPLKVFHSRE